MISSVNLLLGWAVLEKRPSVVLHIKIQYHIAILYGAILEKISSASPITVKLELLLHILDLLEIFRLRYSL